MRKQNIIALALVAGMVLTPVAPVFAANTSGGVDIAAGDKIASGAEVSDCDEPVDPVKIDFGEFTNTYTAEPAYLILSGEKILNDASKTGKVLVGDDFSFQLKDSTGKVVDTVKNDKDGKIKFSTMKFTKPGTYTYTIVEVKGEDKHITYDESVKSVTITVTGADGKLSVDVKTASETPTT